MTIIENDTVDFGIEIKDIDALHIVNVSDNQIKFVYDRKRYILSKDDQHDEFMTLYELVSRDTMREVNTQITSLDLAHLVKDSSNSAANKEYFARMLTKLEFATGLYETECASKKAELDQIRMDMMLNLDNPEIDTRTAKVLEVYC